jgi:chromosome segregation ATPase
MSYEYARIPLKPGVNVVCGPNGSGKSSMLIGISVALGQSYTERSKKLSDLIRWGKDQARVTVVLDNSPNSGRRPVPRIRKDYIFLTRSLRRDGKYWFAMENRAATRAEVTSVLARFGVDPENMLIIMHQNMVEQFTVLSPPEKLRIVEAAVGFESYRENVLKAQKKLSHILSQEQSVGRLLESAEQTLSYWREQYDRYQQKKQLKMKRQFLEREFAWAKVSKKEKTVTELKEQIQKKRVETREIEKKATKLDKRLKENQRKMEKSRVKLGEYLEERIRLEREKTKQDLGIVTAEDALNETATWVELQHVEIEKCLEKIRSLETQVHASKNPIDLKTQLDEIKKTYRTLETGWTRRLDIKREGLHKTLEDATAQLAKVGFQISDVKAKTGTVNLEMVEAVDEVLNCKINLALMEYQKEILAKALKKMNSDLKIALVDLEETVATAKGVGHRIVPVKSMMDILDEIRVTDGHLSALTDVSGDIEQMYESYSTLYLELKEKAQVVAENREKGMKEVKTRMEAWRRVIRTLLDQINQKYRSILSEVYAVGDVRLRNEHDLEEAGLEISVGFKGGPPIPLNSFTQSGGERSTATMTFLLALQQNVRSPFRAVDEYDVHMDPKNREIVTDLIVSSVGTSDDQYLVITPSQLTFTGNDAHVITVQNVEGTSLIKEVT